MFADDTNLSCQGKSSTEIENKIDTDLENAHKWLIANKLTLNQEKTDCNHCMLVGSRQRLQQSSSNAQIVIGNHVIQQVPSKKVLGDILSLEKSKAICKSNYTQCME
jgi:hypothetical protein